MTNTLGQISLFGEALASSDMSMFVKLNIKKPSEFFWLRSIRDVDISQCCAKCFIGDSDTRMYHGTVNGQTPRSIELELAANPKYIAYYLCGLAKNFVYRSNTHIAFVHAPKETLAVENGQIELTITNARHIDFQKELYKPNPVGRYDEKQRACRNWIFACYIVEKLMQTK